MGACVRACVCVELANLSGVENGAGKGGGGFGKEVSQWGSGGMPPNSTRRIFNLSTRRIFNLSTRRIFNLGVLCICPKQ